jgi:hypothetical protein
MGYYTPEQAVTKICPYLTMGGRMENCKAGACMLWRWQDGVGPDDVESESLAQPPEPPPIPTVFVGFCGIGGHPGQDKAKPKDTSKTASYDSASDRPALS